MLAPGEKKKIIFKIKKEYLAGYDSKYHTWVSEPGWYRALVGNSSRSVACEQRFKAHGHSEYDFGPDTMMVRILNCPEAINVIDRCFEGIIPIEAVKEQVRYMPHMPFSAVWNNIIAQAVKKPPDMIRMNCTPKCATASERLTRGTIAANLAVGGTFDSLDARRKQMKKKRDERIFVVAALLLVITFAGCGERIKRSCQ